MASVFDVAKFVLEQRGKMTTKKLQKLVYYSQAWSLAWSGEPIFNDRVRGWKDGPVVGTLHREHRGWLMVEATNLSLGESNNLSGWQREAICSVLARYGNHSADELGQMTHDEEPWLAARRGLGPDDSGNEEITCDSMRDFYKARAGLPGSPRSPELLRHLSQGIEDARAGRIVDLGSFAQHLED
jgi:uncharacterized phage-associated protein